MSWGVPECALRSSCDQARIGSQSPTVVYTAGRPKRYGPVSARWSCAQCQERHGRRTSRRGAREARGWSCWVNNVEVLVTGCGCWLGGTEVVCISHR